MTFTRDEGWHHDRPGGPLAKRVAKRFGLGLPPRRFVLRAVRRGHETLLQARALVRGHRVERVAAEDENHEQDHHELDQIRRVAALSDGQDLCQTAGENLNDS